MSITVKDPILCEANIGRLSIFRKTQLRHLILFPVFLANNLKHQKQHVLSPLIRQRFDAISGNDIAKEAIDWNPPVCSRHHLVVADDTRRKWQK